MNQKYRRNRGGKMSIIDAERRAHEIAFFPFTFQAINALMQSGILDEVVDNNGIEESLLEKKSGLTKYAMTLILDIAFFTKIFYRKDDLIYPTKLAKVLKDQSIQVNFNFMRDVCYLGANHLWTSLKSGKPEGLKVFGDWDTIYQGLTKLPNDIQKSWFDFDNYYSDLAFDDAIKIVLENNPKLIYDIGGNTAKFDIAILRDHPDIKTVIYDLSPQIELAKNRIKKANLLNNVDFQAFNALGDDPIIGNPDAIWMSQFLDCFSKSEILFILKKVAAVLNTNSRLFILEPFIDQQNEVAALSLTNISLYFTCIANGNSKMYRQTEMEELVKNADLKVVKSHQHIGKFDYTLLECSK